MTYSIHFIGRRIGALGTRYGVIKTVTAPTPEAAKLALYDTYEHITVTSVHEVPLVYNGVEEVT